ncbi:MAG: PIN domain-containing protein [Armatimonadetes bacterium]|nr:PIN domain-containing protein [Armatimonadota bacterium]
MTRLAYVDTSCYVAVAFGEPGAAEVADALESFDERISSNLLEAELRAAFARENVTFEPRVLGGLGWILPDRPLSPEFAQVLGAGYARGADLWHLAVALYLAEIPGDMTFLTLDERQRELARYLGFRTE